MADNKEIQVKQIDSNVTSGNVKITAYKHGRKCEEIVAHNTGTINLCDYIARALVGNYVIAERPYIITPCYLDASNKLAEIGNGSPCIEAKIGVSADTWGDQTSDQYEDGGYCSAVLTFNIPSQIVSGEEISGFILRSKDDSRKKYAEVNIVEEGYDPLHPTGDTNLKVDWIIYVSYRWDIDRSEV